MEQTTSHVWRAGLSASLLGGVLGSPVIWAVHLQLVYTLVKYAQRTQHYGLLYAATSGCLLLTIGCGVLSWNDWRRTGRASLDEPEDGRCRFLGVLGMFSSGLFTLVILATGLAEIYLNAAWD
ncbi:MAG: hypothetical protein JWM57_482 [Phycisphaerales bacterium]|nr:hypothetical protein [Phycisphaerales bacterium]